MEIFKLFGSILIDSDKADKSLQKTGKHTESMGSKLGKGLKTAVGFGIGLAAAGAAGAAALFGVATKSAEATDRIDKMSQKMGMSKKGFQEWDYVLSQNGVSMEGMQMGMKRMTQAAQQSAEGVGKGAESFKALGVSVTDASGKMKSQDQIFNESVTALQGMEDGTVKASLAQDLFGRSGQEMLPLLNGNAEGVTNLKNKANDLGMVLSDKAVKAGVKFTDQLDTMKRVMGGVVSEIGVELMPIFAEMMDWVMANMPTIKKVVKKAFDTIARSVKWVIDNSNWLIPVLAGVAAAFVGLKVISVITGLVGAFNLVMSLNPIVLVIAALVLLGIGIYNVVKHWKDIVKWIKKAWDWLDTWNNEPAKDKTVNTRYTSSGSTSQYGGVSRGRTELAIGSRYVPHDMQATIHRGEMVVPRSENPYANSGGQIMPGAGGGFSLNIENFVNNRAQDVQALAEELSFYMKQKNLGN